MKEIKLEKKRMILWLNLPDSLIQKEMIKDNLKVILINYKWELDF